MNKKTFHIAVILFAAFLAVLVERPASAADVTLTVPTDYSTIQSAINAANAVLTQPTNTLSYEVLVLPGTYHENITLVNDLPLRGQETATTILTGGGSGTIMTAIGAVSSVTIRNFTFQNASTGILVPTGSSAITIENNVFNLGPSNAAVQVASPVTSVSVINNTFYLNLQAVVRSDINTQIKNNIFSNNTTAILNSPSFADQTNISYNDFNPPPAAGAVIGTDYLPNTVITNPDPLFVNANAAPLDTHLTSSSPCIDAGDPSILDSTLDGSRSDMGAYGGPYTDTVPIQVSGLSSSATTSSSVTLSWTASQDYLVQGYKLYYGPTSGKYTGTDATQGPSPIDVGNVTSSTVSGLTTTVTTPTAPTLYEPIPVNGGLVLNWSAVTGASSYNVYYHLASSTTTEFVIQGIIGTSYTLTGLTNGTSYIVQVSAVSQAADYFAVTAYYKTGGTPGVSYESAYSAEEPVYFGSATESARSGEVQGLPEATVAYPNLPNSGCFIATAAYNSPDAAPVMVFRAFRDRYLLGNAPGRAFIGWYYRTSPEWARRLNSHPVFKPLVRLALAPLLAFAYLSNALSPAVALALMVLLAAAAAVAFHRFRKTGRSTC